MKKILLFVIVAVLGYAGYKTHFAGKKTAPAPVFIQTVDTVKAALQPVKPEVSFVSKIESPEKVGLRARVTGFLQEKLFNEGDLVQKGQPLFIIEKVNFEAQVRQAEANLAKAEAAAVNAKAQYDRTNSLFKTKDVSAAKLDEARAAHDSAVASVAQMKALLDLARKDLEYTTIVSPMDGKIGEKAFSVGELISPSSGVLAEIVSVNPMDALFSISENQLLAMQEQFGSEQDADVYFITSNDKVYAQAGKIDFIDVALDEVTNTLKLKASFPNPDKHLISGQYGRVLIKGKNNIDRIVIPMKAVQRDLKEVFVYIVTPDNKIEKRVVVEGFELPNYQVVIEDGLKPDDQIVIAGFQKIMPGMTVNPTLVK